VKAIAASYFLSLALLSDGTVWAWGDNRYGQLGTGGPTSGCPLSTPPVVCSPTPVEVQGLTNVVAIADGGNDGLALRSDGTVWAWGNNGSAQLGAGGPTTPGGCPGGTSTDICSATPVQVQGLAHVTAIAMGPLFGMAVVNDAASNDGTVWAWGYSEPFTLPNIFLLSPCPSQPVLDECNPSPFQVQVLDHITALATDGSYYALALRDDGTVWAWGHDDGLQLGDSFVPPGFPPPPNTPLIVGEDVYAAPLTMRDATAIAAGGSHGPGLAVINDGVSNHGTVWAWGADLYGGTGSPPTAEPLQCHAFVDPYYGKAQVVPCQLHPTQVPGLTGVTAVVASQVANYALKADGTVWAWGTNIYGQLGNGSEDPFPPTWPATPFPPHPTPSQVVAQGAGNPALTGVTAIAAGQFYALAVVNVVTLPQVAVGPLCAVTPCLLLPPIVCPQCVGFPDPAQYADPLLDVRTLVLTNPDVNPIQVTDVRLTGAAAQDFAITADSCRGTTLRAGSSTCRVGVRFSPGAFDFGQRTATLVVASASLNVGARGAARSATAGQEAITLVGANPVSVAKLARIPAVWAAGGVLALLLLAAVATAGRRRRRADLAAAKRVGG
jgi:alpha-tubulin suppressor-like RCC1 family protein